MSWCLYAITIHVLINNNKITRKSKYRHRVDKALEPSLLLRFFCFIIFFFISFNVKNLHAEYECLIWKTCWIRDAIKIDLKWLYLHFVSFFGVRLGNKCFCFFWRFRMVYWGQSKRIRKNVRTFCPLFHLGQSGKKKWEKKRENGPYCLIKNQAG